MPYRESVLISSVVVLWVTFRLFMLSNMPADSMPTQPPMADLSFEELRSSSLEIGITRVEYQRFDRDAVFAVQPGPDLMPGVAGTDDNMNGITDDRLELGATRSDDVCVILTPAEVQQSSSDEIMVLQHGAFVSTEEHKMHRGDNLRAIVFGISADNSHWSFVRDLPRLAAKGIQIPAGR